MANTHFRFEEDITNFSIKENMMEYSFGEEQKVSKEIFQKKQDSFKELDSTQVQEMNKKSEIVDKSENSLAISVDSYSVLNSTPGLKESAFKEGKLSSNVGDFVRSDPLNIEELQKGRTQLIRLQAVSNNSTTTTTKASMSNSNNFEFPSDGLGNQIYANETEDLTNQSSVCSESQYQFATSSVTSIPVGESSNIQLMTANSTSDLIQKAFSSISEKTSTPYQHVILSAPVPEFNILEQDKATSNDSSLKTVSWTSTTGTNNSSNCSSDNINLYQASNSETEELSSFSNIDNVKDSSEAQPMQRFITSDNQIIYGYKDSNGELHFFSPTINDRECHNEKERKRRTRVSEACSALRRMIPGISEKTDKATVFEYAAKYLKFLRDKFGTQYDQIYCEKFFQERK